MPTQELESLILGIIQSQIDAYSNPALATYHRNRSGLLLLERHKAALEGWIRYEPRQWFEGGLTDSESKYIAREVRRMEQAEKILCRRDNRQRIHWIKAN